MDEHDRLINKVSDWLADGWDWDAIAAAIGMEPHEAADRFGPEVAAHIREMEQRAAEEPHV